nr:hypothetical protein [uncultured Carboxylicivirga sp.]
MNKLNINWKQKQPNQQQSVDIWEKTGSQGIYFIEIISPDNYREIHKIIKH